MYSHRPKSYKIRDRLSEIMQIAQIGRTTIEFIEFIRRTPLLFVKFFHPEFQNSELKLNF